MPERPASLDQQRPVAASCRPVDSWALAHAEELGALREAARDATRGRRPTDASDPREHLAEQRLLLVVSELATNALKYGHQPVVVSLSRTDDGWLVDVQDSNGHSPPVAHPPARGRIGRNGLLIIDRASTAWGWYQEDDDARVKHVWSCVPDPAHP